MINDIRSVAITVGYKKGVYKSLYQPMQIEMRDGAIQVFYIKSYSKGSVMWILKNLRTMNSRINFSKSCQELIKLSSPYKLTKTEKKDFQSNWL